MIQLMARVLSGCPADVTMVPHEHNNMRAADWCLKKDNRREVRQDFRCRFTGASPDLQNHRDDPHRE